LWFGAPGGPKLSCLANVLHAYRKPAGTFIVRKSIKDGSFVLSMAGKMTYNFKIVEKALMFLILDDKNKNQPEFHSVPDLLEHFKRIDPNASGGLPVRLTNVLPFSAYSR
jgi:hypothetical protein